MNLKNKNISIQNKIQPNTFCLTDCITRKLKMQHQPKVVALKIFEDK